MAKPAPSQPIADPAILSFARPPKPTVRTDSLATATLSGPFNELSLDSETKVGRETAELATTEDGDGSFTASVEQKKTQVRTATREKAASRTAMRPNEKKILQNPGKSAKDRIRNQELTESGLDVSPTSKENRRAKRGSPKQFVHSSRKQRVKKALEEAQNGWATEDATDIQEGGDFDFEANLSKFDKSQVFKQLREDDTVAHDSRLVSHNRLPPKSGTAGGKNLHWTENVLDSPQMLVNGVWDSEAEDSEHEKSDAFASSGRTSSRTRNRKFSARSAGGRAEGGNIDPPLFSKARGGLRQNSSEIPASPKSRSKAGGVLSPFPGTTSSTKPSLKMVDSNRTCPCLTPLQMLELEQYATAASGLGELVLIENAGRSIAEAVIQSLSGQGKTAHRFHVVILAGNHRTGIRALAAGRHLRNRGFKVTATVMGLEREDQLMDEAKAQATAYRKAGGYLAKPGELLTALGNGGLYPAVVVDALLGVHLVVDDLPANDQTWVFELISEINRESNASVIAVDVPSGVDASTGDVASLALEPSAVVWLGAPKPWFLASLKDFTTNRFPNLFVADIGIANSAWKRLGHRKHRGIHFGSEWVAKLRVWEGEE